MGSLRDAVTAAELEACTSVLQRLRPAELQQPTHTALLEAGKALMRRAVLKEQFGSKEVVEFLAERTKQKETLRELKRLHELIQGEHRRARIEANEVGLNSARKAQLELIKKECAALELSDTTPRLTSASEPVAAVAFRPLAGGASVRVVLRFGAGAAQEAAEQDVATEVPTAQGVPAEAGRAEAGRAEAAVPPPQGDFRRICNVCRGDYSHLPRHHFYHQLCPRCAEFNLEKREQSVGMGGMVAVVTGGRVRIGYATVLKLLRAGATVLATTRFPCDAAARYAREPDFDAWRERLEVVGPLELSDLRRVEAFCDELTRRFPRIHLLVNNAAQTLTRPLAWHQRMAQLEHRAAEALPPAGRALLASGTGLLPRASAPRALVDASGGDAAADAVVATGAAAADAAWLGVDPVGPLDDFPEHQLDESRQPLDLSAANSWSRR